MMKYLLMMVVTYLYLGLYSQPAAAAYVTGDDLLKDCRSNKAQDVYACMNYVAGVIDYQVVQQSLGTEPSVDFCLPEDLSIEKAAVSVMLYLEKSPQMGSFIAAPTVAMALQQAYPCGPIRRAHKKHRRDE